MALALPALFSFSKSQPTCSDCSSQRTPYTDRHIVHLNRTSDRKCNAKTLRSLNHLYGSPLHCQASSDHGLNLRAHKWFLRPRHPEQRWKRELPACSRFQLQPKALPYLAAVSIESISLTQRACQASLTMSHPRQPSRIRRNHPP